MVQPIRIHPENPKCFEFRGKPLMLLTATEHYGAIMNRPFDFEKYIVDAAEKKMTLTRLFVLFRELQNHCNPYSTCKPETPDYISPFERTGPGKALDGLPKYDLDRPNPEFFERLHRFVSLTSDAGIVVEVVLFSNTYAPEIWNLNPLNSKNNVNGLEETHCGDYMTRRDSNLYERQVAHAKKIVEELNKYDNVIYEICNEPGGGMPGRDENPKPDEVNRWLSSLIQVVREAEKKLPNQHLIVGQEAFTYDPWEQSSDRSFNDMDYDVVNMHPLPNTTYKGKGYEMGVFMSKQLNLRAIRDFCLATYGEPKPLNQDEDNIASQFKDYDGWTIHRKRAWTTLMCGCHYDYIDFSIINYCPTGTPLSQKYIRSWMKYLSEFVHAIDLARARPQPGFLKSQPKNTIESVLAVAGEDYSVYLADGRELEDSGAGQPIEGSIECSLPKGRYRVSCFDPKTGLYSPYITVSGGDNVRIDLPVFVADLAVRIQKAE